MVDRLEALYREHLQEFRRVAAAIVGDRDAACDVVQDAFAKAVRERRRFRGDGTLDAWVWRIVVNAARDARRRRSHDARDAVPAAKEPPGAEPLPFELLTERQREIVFLHYYADLDYTAIAEALAISPGTVGATLTAARRRLRDAREEVRT